METLIDRILTKVGATESDIFITSTDHSNYRYHIYPEYKANRKAPKPVWYEELRMFLLSDWNAEVIFKMEADDAIGIASNENTVICSIDKDLDQIEGKHYDFVKDVEYEVSQENAIRFFYFQILTGDTTDNIPGCKGIGPVKANEALDGLRTVADYEKAIAKLYQDSYGEQWYDKLTVYGQCLKIKRKEDEPLWLPEHLVALKHEESEVSSKP